ncbi:M20 family metallopeptidase [Vibrio sp. Isolate31]|uniref:M20 metallopeptidase family protein n=1 Tax=unclassified Vibrio TaxID=2614977 RepID=UPI001EFCE87B|nr:MULTISPECIES: M20 family metallopeptidase [unclassified Vibrio]MCG9555823.1 M20 family metallopeptidase [Vibrio sp. Isolate32]MCG9602493.1 M20 family metallopeptidase [Vibrio sp. Isolate31]
MLTSTPVTLIDENLVNSAIEWRRELHQIPELCFDLYKTQQYLINLLKDWNVEYDLGYGKTGIVVTIQGNEAGKTIAFRCDMDALPMSDESGCEWSSTHDGAAHTCGHDGHMAITLAAIKHLHLNNNFKGTVKILFQPSEENGQGAKAMMKDGLYAKHPYTELYGFHNMPRLEDGTMQVRFGATTGAGEIFTLSIMGKSGHSSVPQKCINPITIASEIISHWDTITGDVHPSDMAIIAVCKLNSGSTMNGIPDSALAGGTMRYFEARVADYMREQMHQVAKLVCERYGATYDLLFEVLCPATINTQSATNTVIDCAEEIFGKENIVTNVPASPGGEDMQFFVTDKVTQACWFMLGTKGTNLHTSSFDFDDTSIRAAASMIVNITHQRLI